MAMLCAMACVENKILLRAKNMKGLEKYGVVCWGWGVVMCVVGGLFEMHRWASGTNESLSQLFAALACE